MYLPLLGDAVRIHPVWSISTVTDASLTPCMLYLREPDLHSVGDVALGNAMIRPMTEFAGLNL